MSRFSEAQKGQVYSATYTLPRRVTMITRFLPVVEEPLHPMTEVKPVADAPYQRQFGVRWVEVVAVRNKNEVRGWIPKSVLHDLAYAKLIQPTATGNSYGGDKIDYDTNRPTGFLQLTQYNEFKSRCDVCGHSLNAHKMYEDDNIVAAKNFLFECLGEDRKGVGRWQPKAGHNGKSMVGICRLTGGRHLAAYSGYDVTGFDRFKEDVEGRVAVKVGQKGRWTAVRNIPQGTSTMFRRADAPLHASDLKEIFDAAGIRLDDGADLSAMHCAAPKLLYAAYNSGDGKPDVEAFSEWWYDPENAKNYDNHLGRVDRRHDQTVPSCSRCSVVVRLIRCPN